MTTEAEKIEWWGNLSTLQQINLAYQYYPLKEVMSLSSANIVVIYNAEMLQIYD